MNVQAIDGLGETRRAEPRHGESRHGEPWAGHMLTLILGVLAVRILVNALALAPLHFDEAQYWTYGEEPAFGYYSKPPLAAWLIRFSTELFGDTELGVRALAPVLHGWIAWLIFATGRRLFEARSGFWAGAVYLAMPGVTVSSGLMTTDPAMMAAWGAALYALVRALQAEVSADPAERGGRLIWWGALGAAVGLGLLAKYTMVAFLGGCLGYVLFSRQGRWGARRTDYSGPAVAAFAAVLALSPNLYWNAMNDFATIAHVGDNAKLGGGPKLDIVHAIEFLGAQAAIFGPVMLVALALMLVRGGWRDEWEFRLLMWLTLPLPLLMTVQAFLSRAHPNWAAPAYIAGALVVATWLLDRRMRGWVIASLAVGALAFVGFWGLAGVYAKQRTELPRLYDPFKKMRIGPAICEKALAARTGALAEARLLSSDRRLLADCMFAGKLGTDDIAIFNGDGRAGNHYELTSSLAAGEEGPFLLVLRMDQTRAARFTGLFRQVVPIETGEIRTHADRVTPFFLAQVSGFNGY